MYKTYIISGILKYLQYYLIFDNIVVIKMIPIFDAIMRDFVGE